MNTLLFPCGAAFLGILWRAVQWLRLASEFSNLNHGLNHGSGLLGILWRAVQRFWMVGYDSIWIGILWRAMLWLNLDRHPVACGAANRYFVEFGEGRGKGIGWSNCF